MCTPTHYVQLSELLKSDALLNAELGQMIRPLKGALVALQHMSLEFCSARQTKAPCRPNQACSKTTSSPIYFNVGCLFRLQLCGLQESFHRDDDDDDDDIFIVKTSLKFVLRHINSICNITDNKTLRQENKLQRLLSPKTKTKDKTIQTFNNMNTEDGVQGSLMCI